MAWNALVQRFIEDLMDLGGIGENDTGVGINILDNGYRRRN